MKKLRSPRPPGGPPPLDKDLVEFAFVGPGPANWVVVGLYFDSQSAGVREAWNVTGADERGGTGTNGPHNVILTFDVPTDDPAGPPERFLTGDLVAATTTPPSLVPGRRIF